MNGTRSRRILTKAVCFAVISAVLIAAVAFLALAAFWWADEESIASARSNGEALQARLKTGVTTIRAGEIVAAVGLSPKSCTCISTPYADPGSSFVVGHNDITSSFGTELMDEGVVSVMTFEPNANGAVEKALIARGRVDFSVPLTDAAKTYSGIWCGLSEATGSAMANGNRIVLTFNASMYAKSACKIARDL